MSSMSKSEGRSYPSGAIRSVKAVRQDDLRKGKPMGLEPRSETEVDI